MDNKILHLTGQETQILQDLCFAMSKFADNIDLQNTVIQAEMDETNIRQAIRTFDFFRCVWYGHTEGIKRQMSNNQNGGYYDGAIRDYKKIMVGLMVNKYSIHDIEALHKRLKEFIKSLKEPEPKIMYIADYHFCHGRMNTNMDKRGFSYVEEMNNYMIEQWNAKVRDKDTIYILGDLSLAGGVQTSRILSNLNGKKHLIKGNHDDRYLRDKSFDSKLLESVSSYKEVRDKGRSVVLSHYPIFCYKGQYRKDNKGNPLVYMLYGHVHNTHDEELVHRFIMQTRNTKVMSKDATEPEAIPCNMINCFCMFSNYKPMTLDEWIEIDKKQRERMI